MKQMKIAFVIVWFVMINFFLFVTYGNAQSFPEITFKKNLSEKDWKFLKNQPSAFSLNLSETDICDEDLNKLKELKWLRSLALSQCPHITSTGIIYLSELQNLEALDLSSTDVCDNDLKQLKDLTCLKFLTVCNCSQITNTGIIHISEFQNLEVLDLSICGQITDSGLAPLKKLTKLQQLYLTGCRKITRSSIDTVSEIKTLKMLFLVVFETNFTTEDFEKIQALPDLKGLLLNHCNNISLQNVRKLLETHDMKSLELDDFEQVQQSEIDELRLAFPNCYLSIYCKKW